MNSHFFLAIFCLGGAIGVAYSAVKSGNCPKPRPPNGNFNFSLVQLNWYEMAHTDLASREDVICVEQQIYPSLNGEVDIILKGGHSSVLAWKLNFTKGSFPSNSTQYYFNVKSSEDAFITQYWFPYIETKLAILYACSQLTPTTFTDKGWLLSRAHYIDSKSRHRLTDILEKLTGQKAVKTSQNDIKCYFYRG